MNILFNQVDKTDIGVIKVLPVLLPLEDSKNIELLNPEDPNSNIYKVY